jgi:D-3-phosphoglycerate dehydrogenase
MYKLAILTPIDHIPGLLDLLQSKFYCLYFPDEEFQDIKAQIGDVDVVFINPNAARFRIDKTFLDNCSSLKAVFTASTGTNHIDLDFAEARGIFVFSLKDEQDLIQQLTSTAELALTFALISTRKLLPAISSVKDGDWDYRPFIGRQFSELSIGVIGFGRLGKMFARYCDTLGAKVSIFDPFTPRINHYQFVEDISDICLNSDVISLHVHHTSNTEKFIDARFLSFCKPEVTIINTSRGEVVDELSLLEFLENNPSARYCTDVLSNEIDGREANPLVRAMASTEQIIMTPHVGGMTSDGQYKAYFFTANKLIDVYGHH